MSHVRPGSRKRGREKPNCRKGIHLFGPSVEIGGGITRRVCELCSAVSIDLSGAHMLDTPTPDDFARRPATHRSS